VTTPRRLHLLLVDDDVGYTIFARAAFDHTTDPPLVSVVHDGEAALARLRADDDDDPIDLVLLDLHLPAAGGDETLTELRGDVVGPQVPVIVVSSSDADRDVRAAYKAGANAYITKPTSHAQLVDVAEAICSFWTKTLHPSCG
jgi:chemotaxis family two-component system response regulator Rcp1